MLFARKELPHCTTAPLIPWATLISPMDRKRALPTDPPISILTASTLQRSETLPRILIIPSKRTCPVVASTLLMTLKFSTEMLSLLIQTTPDFVATI